MQLDTPKENLARLIGHFGTQYKVAKELNMPAIMVSRYLRDIYHPSYSTQIKIINLYKKTFDK